MTANRSKTSTTSGETLKLRTQESKRPITMNTSENPPTDPTDPMEYYQKFGGEDAELKLSVSDSLCSRSSESLHGLLQMQMHDDGQLACAYLTPAEMRELAGELVKLAALIEAHGKHVTRRTPR